MKKVKKEKLLNRVRKITAKIEEEYSRSCEMEGKDLRQQSDEDALRAATDNLLLVERILSRLKCSDKTYRCLQCHYVVGEGDVIDTLDGSTSCPHCGMHYSGPMPEEPVV